MSDDRLLASTATAAWLELAGLVGPGCPWETVSDMARDLARVLELSEVYPEGTRNHRSRIAAAITLLRQSGEKEA